MSFVGNGLRSVGFRRPIESDALARHPSLPCDARLQRRVIHGGITLGLAILQTMNATMRAFVFGLLVLATVSPGALASQALAGSGWMASRAELERRISVLEQVTASSAYSERMRASANREIAEIRSRLTDGDFRIGDRVYVEVEGVEPLATQGPSGMVASPGDTATVLDGARINIRMVGEVSLAGVLRSELQGRVSAAVSEVILNARATARPLVRIAVFGAVARPGFYIVPLETRIDDLVMLAGGPSAEAAAQKISITRGDTLVMDATDVGAAIAAGTVVGALRLREGDQIVVAREVARLQGAERSRFLFLFISPIISAFVFRFLR